MGDVIDSDLGGEFADRVAPHAVGNEEDVPDLLIMLFIGGGHHRMGILIVTAPNAHVGMACVVNLVESNHPFVPLVWISQRFGVPQPWACANVS